MNLNSIIAQYFKEENKRDNDRAVLVRSDGIVVYASEDIKKEAASIGALVGGVWQAAHALNMQISPKASMEEYRFSFDKSDSGLYILPLKIMGKDYYFSTLYKDTYNPALLKRNFRLIKEELERYLDKNENLKVQPLPKKEVANEKSDFLFTNITDEEIDKLFAF